MLVRTLPLRELASLADLAHVSPNLALPSMEISAYCVCVCVLPLGDCDERVWYCDCVLYLLKQKPCPKHSQFCSYYVQGGAQCCTCRCLDVMLTENRPDVKPGVGMRSHKSQGDTGGRVELE